MKYTFNFVNAFDDDMFNKDYEHKDIKEAEEHAKLLLAEDMNNTQCIEITAEDYSIIRQKVKK